MFGKNANPLLFEGRIGRLSYFGHTLFWALVIGILNYLVTGGRNIDTDITTPPEATGLLLLFAAGSLVSFSYGFRRLHDFDQSGWWYLLSFVPLVNIVLALILLFRPGTPGANRFGTR